MPFNPQPPGEWLTVFPLNEHQELMTLEDFQLLCLQRSTQRLRRAGETTIAGPGFGGDRNRSGSMAQLVHVHYHAAGFDFWVSSVDPYSGNLQGYARILGSNSEGRFCLINYWIWRNGGFQIASCSAI